MHAVGIADVQRPSAGKKNPATCCRTGYVDNLPGALDTTEWQITAPSPASQLRKLHGAHRYEASAVDHTFSGLRGALVDN